MNEKPDFILVRGNPFAPNLVRILACLCNGDTAGAVDAFNALVQSKAAGDHELNPDEDAAAEMMEWAHSVDGEE